MYIISPLKKIVTIAYNKKLISNYIITITIKYVLFIKKSHLHHKTELMFHSKLITIYVEKLLMFRPFSMILIVCLGYSFTN